MRILVVEDDPSQADEIIKHTQSEFGSQISIIGPLTNYKDAILHIETGLFDLAILDIQLQEDIYAGIHIGEIIELKHQKPILFVTGISDERVIGQTESIQNCQFIQKPYDKGAIRRALRRIAKMVDTKPSENDPIKIAHKSRNRDDYWIKQGTSSFISITIQDIVFVEAKDKICEFNMIDGNIFKKRATLEKQVYNETLAAYPNFYKLSRSYVVNLNHINKIDGKRITYPMLKNTSIRIPDDQLKSLFKLVGLDE